MPEVALLTILHPHTNLGHAPNQHPRGSYSHRTSMPEVRQSPNQHPR
eukprot:gene25753-biopygen12021